MSEYNYTESVKTLVNVGSGTQLLDAETAELYEAGLDAAKIVEAKTPIQGAKYFNTSDVTMNNITEKKYHGIGLSSLNSDGEDLPFDKAIAGFESTLYVKTFRNAMQVSREAMEDDRYKVIGKHTKNLMSSGKRTIEVFLADFVNRGFGSSDGATTATSNLAGLCEDGLAMFSGNRPRARATAGVWSNLDSSGALTADAITDADVQFKTFVDLNGDKDPQRLSRVIISPDLEPTMKVLSGTSLKPGTSLNDDNIVSGTQYEVWSWLEEGTFLFEGTAENEMEFLIRKAPSIKIFQADSNPDLIGERLRMRIGNGARCPRRWIGGREV